MRTKFSIFALPWLLSNSVSEAQGSSVGLDATSTNDEEHPVSSLRGAKHEKSRKLPFLICAYIPASDQYYHIVSKVSNMALTVDKASIKDGASIIQAPKTTGRNDNWRLQAAGLSYYQIVAEHSQKGVNGKICDYDGSSMYYMSESIVSLTRLLFLYLQSCWSYLFQWKSYCPGASHTGI